MCHKELCHRAISNNSIKLKIKNHPAKPKYPQNRKLAGKDIFFCLRQKIQKWKICLRQKTKLIADFSLDQTGGWEGGVSSTMTMIGNFRGYKGTNLGYDMICESVNSDQEEKEGDVLNGNRIINLKNLITNIDKILV